MFAFKTIWLFPFSENTFFMFLQFYILSQNQGGKFLILIQLSSLIQFPFASVMFTSKYIYIMSSSTKLTIVFLFHFGYFYNITLSVSIDQVYTSFVILDTVWWYALGTDFFWLWYTGLLGSVTLQFCLLSSETPITKTRLLDVF